MRQLQALAKVSEIVVTASEDESEREAILKEFFLNSPKIGSSFKRLIESQREALVKHPTEFSRSLKIRTGSKKELEAFWREENKRKHNTELHTLPRTFGERPVALRGRDFVDELLRFAAITEDPRFSNAVFALAEHGIIDEKTNFTRWQDPSIAKIEAYWNAGLLKNIRDLKNAGISTRRACMETAATYGLRANSFYAAIKQLQLLYSSDGKKGAA
jgi:hypothetical protein